MSTHPDALLDEVVPITFELVLKSYSLALITPLSFFYPNIVSNSLRLVWGSLPNAIPCFLIAGDIQTLLGFENGGFQSFDAKRNAALSNQKKALETGGS